MSDPDLQQRLAALTPLGWIFLFAGFGLLGYMGKMAFDFLTEKLGFGKWAAIGMAILIVLTIAEGNRENEAITDKLPVYKTGKNITNPSNPIERR